MKRNAFLCLCLCLCILFSACAMPELPEELSVPEESSEAVPVAEDENAKAVRAYLDELLAKEWNAGDEAVIWLEVDEVEAIRDCVKQLETPILTEGDVLRLAEQTLTAVTLLRQDVLRSLELPACGVMAGILRSPTVSFVRSYDDYYRAILSYTLYLFTPPDYLFREDEVGDRSPLISSALWLYLPLAGEYTSRSEVLSLLQEGKNGVELPLYGLAEGEHPLDFYLCGTPVLFRGSGESLLLDLYDLAVKGIGDAEPSEEFRALYAEAYVRKWINRFSFIYSSSIGTGGTYGSYQLPDGTWEDGVYMLLTPEEARELREVVELLSTPVLTEETVRTLALSMYFCLDLNQHILLPGIDGRVANLVGPVEGDPALLAHWVTAFLIDLFTPSAYRFEGQSPLGTGVGYAMQGPDDYYHSPEEALADFINGVTCFVGVDDAGVPYFVDRDGIVDPPAEEPMVSTSY